MLFVDCELFVVRGYCSDSAGGAAVKRGTYAALPNAQSDVQPAGQRITSELYTLVVTYQDHQRFGQLNAILTAKQYDYTASADIGDANLQVTVFWGLGGGVGAVGGGALGQWLYNNISKASMPLFTGITVASATLPMWWLTNANLLTTPIFFTLLLAVTGGMLSSTAGPLNKAMLLNVNEPETRGVALAWQSMTDDLGKGLGPALVSALISALGRSACLLLS